MHYNQGNYTLETQIMFSDQIKKLRQQRGFTIEDLAVALNVSRITYSKWEKGDTSPKADQIPKIADKLGVPIEMLFEQEVEQSDATLKAHIKMVESLSDQDKEIVKGVIIALLHKSNAERVHDLGVNMLSERSVYLNEDGKKLAEFEVHNK